MANFSVTYQDMDAAAKRLFTGRETLDGELTRMKGIVQQLTEAGFTTDRASGAFLQTYSKFTQDMQQAIAGVDSMANFLIKAREAMQQTDDQLFNAISSD